MDIRVQTEPEHAGFFSMLDMALCTLEAGERDGIPTYIDWSGATNYLDEPGNLFDHFFEQPCGIKKEDLPKHRIVKIATHAIPYWRFKYRVKLRYKSWYKLDAARIRETSRLLATHITVKPRFIAMADAFHRDHLSPRTLGIHLRGTDLMYSRTLGHRPTPLLSSYRKAVVREMKRSEYTHIFCASDDQPLLDAFIRTMRESGDLPDSVRIVTRDAHRSSTGKAIHLDAGTTIKKIGLAEDVLLETLILSRCAFLIKSYSNVSSFAVFFRPSLPFFELSSLPIEVFRYVCLLPKQWIFIIPTLGHRMLQLLKR